MNGLRMKSIAGWVLLVAVAIAAYPLIKIGGLLDQAFGIWWVAAIGVCCLAFLIVAGLSELLRKARTKRRVAEIWAYAAKAEKIVARYTRRSKFRPGTAHGLRRPPIIAA